MKKTVLNSKHHAMGAKMVEFGGYEMPVQYSGVIQEHMAVRNAVGIFDVSHMGQFFIEGPNAEPLLQYITTNDVSKLNIGQAQYSAFPNEHGGVVDDLIVYKLEDQKYLLVVNASNIDKDWKFVQLYNQKFNANITNQSAEYGLIALQGPKAEEILLQFTNVNVHDVPYYHFTIGNIGDVENVIISNTGYTGSGGYELYIKNEEVEKVWDLILNAGTKENEKVEPCGLASRDTLRLEKGYCLYGNELNDTTSPIEAGLGWITKFSKEFLGKGIIEKQKLNGVSRKLVGFILDSKGIARHGYKIVDNNGNTVGEVTSGTMSPMLQKGIGLAYVSTENANVGSTLYIQVRDKNLPAIVSKLPFV